MILIIPEQVEDVPLEEISSRSLVAEQLLSEEANWAEGIEV